MVQVLLSNWMNVCGGKIVSGINHRYKLKQFICLGVLSVWAVACSDVRLRKMGSSALDVSSKGAFCISEPQAVQRYTKFLFIVDKSGSNYAGNGGGQPPTDPGAVKRAGNIERFVISNAGKDYIRYGMIVFNGEKAQPYITGGNGSATFTGDSNVVFQATNKLRSVPDEDATPYKAALQQARLAIAGDMQAYPDEQSVYMLFFLSDGIPTDINNDNELDGLVKDMLSLNPGKIFLSTALYGGTDAAVANLMKMAQVGEGKFINLDTSTNWDFNSLIVKPTTEPWQMKNLLVYNWNAGYCEDGAVDTDSDADGMCDRDEVRYGFNPGNRFTHGDGYGDYFHWREVKYNETLPPCTDRSDADMDGLTACEEKYINNDRPSPGIPRHGDPNNPDTDLDGILDGIETFVYFPRTMAFAMDSTNLMRNNLDGEEPAGQQIFEHRNPLVRDAGAKAYDVTLTPVSNGKLDCYAFDQSILPVYPTLEVPSSKTLPWLGHREGVNRVMIYYIQTPQSDPTGLGVYKYSVQDLLYSASSAGLKVDDGVFQTYVVPSR